MGPDNDQDYLDDDLKYGRMLGNLLNPPADPAQTGQPDPRTSVPPGEPPTPTLKTRPTPTPSAPTPSAVTPNGKSKWGDIVRQSLADAQSAQQQSQQAVSGLQSQPSVTTQNAPLIAQRASLAQPVDPKAVDPTTGKPMYKPGIGARIVRGIDAFRRGGVLGVADPGDVGAQPYSAPNRQWSIDTARRAQQVAGLDAQMKGNIDTSKADSDRLKELASEGRATATGALNIGKAASGQQTAETRNQAMVQKGATAGLKPVMDEQGNVTGWEDDTDSEAYRSRQVMTDLREKQKVLDQARADAMNADPNTPAGRAVIQKMKDAEAGHAAAATRANAYMLNATAGNLGTDLKGNQIEGGATTAEGKPVGSRFASPYIKQEGKTAQFNDVLGATDQLENTARALVKSGGKLNDPVVAAGIAEPQGTFGKWVQGQVANGNMTAAQRDYVTNMRAFRENLQALRQSAGGGVSDAQVNRLMEMAPGANTPDIDFLLRQTGQIRNTAGRLSEGLPKMKGGHEVRTGTTPSNSHSSPAKPKGVPDGAVWNPQGNSGKGSWQLQSK